MQEYLEEDLGFSHLPVIVSAEHGLSDLLTGSSQVLLMETEMVSTNISYSWTLPESLCMIHSSKIILIYLILGLSVKQAL